ncbi:MAG: hypothetical protein WBZ36_04525 [Candidatus Nitrosopolaris sp.]
MNKKQFVVIGLKERVILVVIFSTSITWMIATMEGLRKTLKHFRTTGEFFKFIFGQLNKTEQYAKTTSAVADMMVKHGIGLEGTQMFQMFQRDFGGNKVWI